MSDIYSKEKRSQIMSKILGKETKPEILVRRYLFYKGFRFRKNDKRLPGTPDIVLPKYKTVIFVHGCFWHNHMGCKRSKLPKTNTEFWEKKILANVARDNRNIENIKKIDWKVIVVWQCKLEKDCYNELNRIVAEINSIF